MASGNSLDEAPSTLSMNVDESVVNMIGAGEQVADPRVVMSQSMIVQNTSRTIPGLQSGGQGQLIVKTKNGQYQLLRVGPVPMTAVEGVRVVTTGATIATVEPPSPAALTPQQRQIEDNCAKEKCRKFLATLLEISSRPPKSVKRNVRMLIQELIDTKVEPEEFFDRLKKLLKASPQPGLIGFLKKSLPLLRQSLVTKELVINGIRPPPANVNLSIASSLIVSQNQVMPPARVKSRL